MLCQQPSPAATSSAPSSFAVRARGVRLIDPPADDDVARREGIEEFLFDTGLKNPAMVHSEGDVARAPPLVPGSLAKLSMHVEIGQYPAGQSRSCMAGDRTNQSKRVAYAIDQAIAVGWCPSGCEVQ